MSLRIIRPGVLDSFQDTGRFGYRHLGINSDGAMDLFSSQLANAVMGKHLNAVTIEMHFPAAEILFEQPAIFCLSGADFFPVIGGQKIPLNHPIAVRSGAVLSCAKSLNGARSYMALWNELKTEAWMNSYSTNLKAGAGGWKGRALTKADVIPFTVVDLSRVLDGHDFVVLPWKAVSPLAFDDRTECVIGSEWHWLTKDAQQLFAEQYFQITNEADRMGFRLAGKKLSTNGHEELVSSAVSFGTVQLLPQGQVVVLMADHQTAGGYPRIAHVISADLPLLAQKKPQDVVRFKLTTLAEAEEKLVAQKKYLQQLQIACKFRMEEFLDAHL